MSEKEKTTPEKIGEAADQFADGLVDGFTKTIKSPIKWVSDAADEVFGGGEGKSSKK